MATSGCHLFENNRRLDGILAVVKVKEEKNMTKTMRKISEKERLETVMKYAGKPVKELQAEVDAIIEKAMLGTATELEQNRAAVLAGIILDRKG